jgi:hypothetical protein
MPLRVKCRCGQELVLRFNEWVHALFGLLILSLLVNATALVIVVVKLGDLKAPGERAGESGPTGPPAVRTEPAVTPPPAPPLPPAPPPSAVEEAREHPEAAESAGPSNALPIEAESRPETGSPDPPSTPEIVAGGAGSEAPEPRVEVLRPSRPLLPAGSTPLDRLIALEGSSDPALLHGFLQDEDPLLVRRAIEKCKEADLGPGPPPMRDLLAIALPAAPRLLREPDGRGVLRRISGSDQGEAGPAWWMWGKETLGIDASQGAPEASWSPLQARAKAILDASSAARAIELSFRLREGASGPGADFLIVLDMSESMDAALPAIAKGGWIFPALAWAIPGIHMGLLGYDDEVKVSLNLGTDPRDLARALAGLKAEGGGDVPEGVLEALRSALQLGRFEWRPDAVKQIVFVGNGPPRRTEVAALMSLAKECHAEAGYRIHAISIDPQDGRKATLHFPELASAGGGRAVIAEIDRAALEIFLAPFPREARDDLTRLAPLLAAQPAPEDNAPPRLPSARTPPWKAAAGR